MAWPLPSGTPLFDPNNPANDPRLKRYGRYLKGEMLGLGDLLSQQATGEKSFTGEQLRQATQAAMSSQQALAATARPGQEGMAMRIAAQNTGRLQSEMAGQASLAEIAERQAAMQAYSEHLLRQREINQEEKAAQEAARAQKWQAVGNIAAGAGMLFSDERGKKDIRSGRTEADLFLKSIDPRTFIRVFGGISSPSVGATSDVAESVYRRATPKARALGVLRGLAQPASPVAFAPSAEELVARAPGSSRSIGMAAQEPTGLGRSRRRELGFTAQDLERSPAGRTSVAEVRGRKLVDAAQLLQNVTAGVGRLDERLSVLEKRKGKR